MRMLDEGYLQTLLIFIGEAVGMRVLVVEDEAKLGSLLRRGLATTGSPPTPSPTARAR